MSNAQMDAAKEAKTLADPGCLSKASKSCHSGGSAAMTRHVSRASNRCQVGAASEAACDETERGSLRPGVEFVAVRPVVRTLVCAVLVTIVRRISDSVRNRSAYEESSVDVRCDNRSATAQSCDGCWIVLRTSATQRSRNR